jgi:hypothetical protein
MMHPAHIELDVHADPQLADVDEDGRVHFRRTRNMETSMPPIVTQIITSYGGLSKEHNPIAAIRQHLVGMCPQSAQNMAVAPENKASQV